MAVLVGATLLSVDTGPYLALDIAIGVASLALVPFLARWPVQAAVALSLFAVVSPTATPPATMAALLVGWRQRSGLAVAVAVTGIAAHLIRGIWRPTVGLPYLWWAVLVGVAYAGLVGWGMLIRANRALITSLRDRAERAEADQARRVAEARSAERARIAREMHDVLAHRLSLLATYAGALAYRPDAPPEQLSGAAEVVRSGVHQALDELREVIGVLRDDSLPDLAAGRSPLPSIADLPELIEESRAAGTPVETGGAAWAAATPVPDVVGRTAYRVVQEGLTNARKHAPGQPVSVTLGGHPGAGLEVSVVNGLGAVAAATVPGTGTGLIGLSERLELAGGKLNWRNSGDEFRLCAWLPWPEAAGFDPTGPSVTAPGVPAPGVPARGSAGAE
ncbi:MAG TPA: histidine kinase [Trebonia sp.]|jgi:signal transduction histidine kinase